MEKAVEFRWDMKIPIFWALFQFVRYTDLTVMKVSLMGFYFLYAGQMHVALLLGILYTNKDF